MGAPKGNEYYLKQSKHGRDKIFSTPDELWTAACEYFKHVDDSPWIRQEPIKSGDLAGTCMQVEIPRPYKIRGLCLYLKCTEQTLINYGTKEQYKAFFEIVKQIKDVIYDQKFDGAAVGDYNSNIIARDLGLIDSKKIEHEGEVTQKNIIKFGDSEVEV